MLHTKRLEIIALRGVGPVTHNAVEAVEGGVEVGLPAQAVHLYAHLRQEYPQKDKFSKI